MYSIRRISEDDLTGDRLSTVTPRLQIDSYIWDQNGYKPEAEACVCYTDNALHIFFEVFEQSIYVKHFKMNEDVFDDSCVEFFFKPSPLSDDRYMNFEVNAAGILLLGIGKDRKSRSRIRDISPDIFEIRSSIPADGVGSFHGPSWKIHYTIPFSFIRSYFGNVDFVSGTRLKGNFYKCGDKTGCPHYGSWNPVECASPDFHRPEYFGDLISE